MARNDSLGKQLPNLSDKIWDTYHLPEIRILARDFTDEELVKLSILHFHDKDSRPKEELVSIVFDVQYALREFAEACGLEYPHNRLYATAVMFQVTGPIMLEGI